MPPKVMKFRSPKEFIPAPESGTTAFGGIYGMREIEKFTGLQGRIMRMLYIKNAFPLIKLPGGGWYLHKDLFYMWMLSAQRRQLQEFQNVEQHVIADAVRRLDKMKQDFGLVHTPEETELFKRIYLRVFGSDEAIEMVTGYDERDSRQRARAEACINYDTEGVPTEAN